MRRTMAPAILAAAVMLAAAAPALADESPSESPTATSDATSTELERVSAYTQPSVVYIGITWTGYVWDTFNKQYLNKGEPFEITTQCTGYVVNPDGYIATAGHCVDHNEILPSFQQTAAQWALENGYYQATDLTLEQVLGFDDYVVYNDERKRKPDLKVVAAWSVSAGGVETGKALPARVVKWQRFENGDGAMLKVEADNLNALPLAEDGIDIGTEIVAVGYPGSVDLVADADFTPSYKDGAVSSQKTVAGGLLKVYEISAAVSGGMSGGPTVNLDGEVVGFNSFGINQQVETQQFNFVRPVDTVRELLGDAGAANELSEDSQDYREGLDAFFAGDKTTAVEKLGAVVENQPTFELAKTYLDKAEELPEPVEEDSGALGMVAGIIVGVLVLAALAVAVLLLMLRKKKGSSGSDGQTPAFAGQGAGYAGAGAPGGGAAGPGASSGPSGPGYAPAGPGPMGAGGPAGGAGAPGQGGQPGGPTPSAPQAGQEPSGQAPPPPPPSAPSEPAADTSAEATGDEEEENLFCSNCGTRHEAGQKFCKHCGAAL